MPARVATAPAMTPTCPPGPRANPRRGHSPLIVPLIGVPWGGFQRPHRGRTWGGGVTPIGRRRSCPAPPWGRHRRVLQQPGPQLEGAAAGVGPEALPRGAPGPRGGHWVGPWGGGPAPPSPATQCCGQGLCRPLTLPRGRRASVSSGPAPHAPADRQHFPLQKHEGWCGPPPQRSTETSPSAITVVVVAPRIPSSLQLHPDDGSLGPARRRPGPTPGSPWTRP